MYRPRLLYLLLLPALLAQASLALGGSATDPKPLPDMRIRQVLARHVHKGEPIPDIGVPAPWPTYNLVFVIDNLGPGVLHQSGTEFELMVECQDLTAGKPCTSPAIPPRYYLTVYRDVPPNDPAGLIFQTDWQGNEGAGDDWNHQLRVKAAINPQKQIKESDAAQDANNALERTFYPMQGEFPAGILGAFRGLAPKFTPAPPANRFPVPPRPGAGQ